MRSQVFQKNPARCIGGFVSSLLSIVIAVGVLIPKWGLFGLICCVVAALLNLFYSYSLFRNYWCRTQPATKSTEQR